jgi:hypothetical protein
MIRLVLTTARTSWRVIPHTGLAAKCTHYPLRFLRFMLGEAQCDLFGPRSHITSELELKSTKRSNAILQQLLKIITMDTNNDGDDGDELSTLETEIQRLRVEISETVGRELHPRGNVDDSGAKDIAKEEDTSRMNCPLRKQLQLVLALHRQAALEELARVKKVQGDAIASGMVRASQSELARVSAVPQAQNSRTCPRAVS